MSFEEAMKHVEIIPPRLHGKITREGKLSEPDIYYIVEKWLARHSELKARQQAIRIVRGRWTLPQGVRTEVVSVSILAGNDITDTIRRKMLSSMNIGLRKNRRSREARPRRLAQPIAHHRR
jgi:hypothetical protein